MDCAYLGKHVSNLEHFELRAAPLVFSLIHTIRDNHPVQRTSVNTINRIATEHAVRDKRVDRLRALPLQQLGSPGNGV